MTESEALDFVNDGPYVFRRFLGAGAVFRFGNNGDRVEVSKNRNNGGINVACNSGVFNFQWDYEKEKWARGHC